jgi:hypothetical protein
MMLYNLSSSISKARTAHKRKNKLPIDNQKSITREKSPDISNDRLPIVNDLCALKSHSMKYRE